MSLSIVTNVTSMLAQENLRVNSEFQSRTITRLTSGLRINQSGDDAAGLAVANSFRGNVAELTQGVRNANDGLSTLQIIDGGLNNISKILDRLRTLATQSSSDTFQGSRGTLQTEFGNLVSELNRQANNIGLGSGFVAGSTSPSRFNTSLSVYIGGGYSQASGAAVSVDISSTNGVSSGGLGISTANISTSGSALTALAAVAAAVDTLGTIQGKVGSGENALAYAVQLGQSQIANFSAAESRIRDADIASEAANLTKAQVMQQASMAAMSQANSAPQSVLSLLRG